MDKRNDSAPPYAPLSRSAVAGKVAGIDLRGDSLRAALSANAEPMRRVALQLGRVSVVLPRGVLQAADRAVYARRVSTWQDTLAHKIVSASRVTGHQPGVDPAALAELVDKKEAFAGLKLLGDRAKDAGLDLRLCFGTYQWFQIDTVVQHLEQRFADPNLTRAEEESLLDAFGPMLVKLEEVLQRGPERKDELLRLRQQAAEETREAAIEAARSGVILDVKAGLSPSRQRLLLAAQRHMQKGGGAAPKEPGPGKAPGAARTPDATEAGDKKGPRILR